jgi:gliding motility-associated-like protein
MRLKFLRLIVPVSCLLVFSGTLNAQNCIPTNINGAIINRACGQLCADINLQIPDIRSSSDYVMLTEPYQPYPYNTPTGTEDFNLYQDDQYSFLVNLPFTFCFYGNNYTSAVVGSNGIMTFDPANASCGNSWPITQPIPFAGGAPCSSGITYYPRASIMGAYSDLDPRTVASAGDRKIQWEVVGTAPCRKFIVSYYHIGVYGVPAGSCPVPANTFQMVIHESTGIVEIFFEQKSCASSTNAGRAIMGVQNWNQNQARFDPAKNNAVWTENNTGYRFIPSAGPSRFVSSQIFTMAGVLVSTATSANTTPGLLDLNFPNVCVAGSSTNFEVRTTYSACDNPAIQLVSVDTITVNLTTMSATATTTATSCNGAGNGTITVTPSSGMAPYTYSLDGAPGVPGPSPFTFTNVPAGNHNVIATDAFGCVTPAIPVTVATGPPLATTASKTDALCNGTATGSITVVQPVLGTGPYQYSLDGITWQISPVFNGLPAGTYTVYFRESLGCQGTLSITIDEPTVLSATSSSVAVVCNGQSNGIITVTAAGGTAPYQYSINGGAVWQGTNIFNVPAGNYTVLVKDANNCVTPQNITVTEPQVLTALSANTNASCNGGSDGTITITASGGNAGFQYSLNGGAFQSSNLFNVGPGNFLVTVKDNLGCTATFNTTVGLNNNLSFTPQTDPTICEGTSTQLNLTSNGTVYSWTPSTGLSNATIHNPVANPTVTTQYVVTSTLDRCSVNDTVIVYVNAAPIPNAGADGFICYGQTYQLQASGGTTYSWTPPAYLDNAQLSNPTSSAPKDMVYTVKIVSDANGCASLVTDDMRLDVTPPIKVKTFPFDTVVYNTDQFQMVAIPSDSDVINYSWTPVIGLSDPTIANPIVTAGNIGDVVQYQVTTSTIAGCKGYGYVTVKVYKGPDFYVPTGFTPNNDGKNDRLIAFPVGIKTLNYFRVYNRWGQLVFSTKALHDGWDGKINGTDQGTGTYVWMVEGVTLDKRVITKRGVATLIR